MLFVFLTNVKFSDTAEVYRNEKFIGDSLKILLPKYNLTREDVFITTKLGSLKKIIINWTNFKKILKSSKIDDHHF